MKIIIIGKGPGYEHAPMEGETWGVNDLVLRRPVKLTFEIHDIDRELDDSIPVLLRARGVFKKEVKKINELGIPVVVSKEHKVFPNGIVFPLDEMPCQYFNNSIAYMIAYAVYKGATEIEMYGVVMQADFEYSHQRPCVEFWIGYAMGKGIKVTVHEPTSIDCFKSLDELYGRKLTKHEG